MNKNLKIFFAKHSFDKKTNEDLWAKVKNKDSSFQEQENPLFHAAPENPKLPSVKILSQTKESYLPLEYMKKEETHFLSQEALKNSPKIFLSSGTTQSNRSLSYFSKDGLTLYKLGSIKTFYDLLSHFFRTDELATIEGISLIPKTDEWPDSSLAQMIQWFSEFWPVTYLKDEKKLPKPPNKALWFFATAIQVMGTGTFVMVLMQ